MEGVTSFPMRIWLSMCSQPTDMTTPFLRVTRTFPEDHLPPLFIPELQGLRGILPYNLVPQLIAGEVDSFLRATELIPPALASVIEINCGCPSPNSLGQFAGSGMLREPGTFARAIERLTTELGPGRLAVKMRLGIESESEFPQLLAAIAALPLARLTVHARTRKDAYRTAARWENLALATRATTTPVHASGNLWGIKSWQKILAVAPEIQGGMVGRGLIRNPWIFNELRTGKEQTLAVEDFSQALFSFLLLHELALTKPAKLMRAIDKNRLGLSDCETSFTWEKPVVELTQLLYGVPFLLLNESSLEGRTLSNQSFTRLRWMWTYLRSSMPQALAPSALVKARNMQEFFAVLLKNAHEAGIKNFTIGHKAEWDPQFSGARG